MTQLISLYLALICKLLAINSLSQLFWEFIYFIIIHISLVCKRQRQMDF